VSEYAATSRAIVQLQAANLSADLQLGAAKPGCWKVRLELVAKIIRAEPWNLISFVGPVAAIASVAAQAAGDGAEVQLLSSTPTEQPPRPRPARQRAG